MTLPRATARLQLHPGFTLNNACAQVPYYASLGVSHLYLSPIWQARPGSMHGYDVIDYTQISTELGGQDALLELAHCVHDLDMGLILDIVPNHMATDSANLWWWDVLRHGADSTYASWLDIDWSSPNPGLYGKVLAPFLDRPYSQALASGAIELLFDEVSQSFQIQACGKRYPLAPDTLTVGSGNARHVAAQYDHRHSMGQKNLHELLKRQHYRLAWWRYAADAINWRRFFEVSDLIGVRVELPLVFNAVHALPLRLFGQGLIDGLRVDHIDGLADPATYCRTLRSRLDDAAMQRPAGLCGDEPWLIVEKILANGETLDPRWPVHGTTGYDFMDQAAAVLHDPAGEAGLTVLWADVADDDRPPKQWLRDARKLMIDHHFVAERNALLAVLSRLARASVHTQDWSIEAIGRVLDQLLIEFPVYRTYADAMGRDMTDAEMFTQVLERVHDQLGLMHGSEHDLLETLDAWLDGTRSDDSRFPWVRDLRSEATQRFQQLTPPLAAKSLEDTVFYRYGRLLSRNEVGSDPDVFARSPDAFHQNNTWRATHAALSMLTTATHDHKRGEDVRARLAVLSEIPQHWAQASKRWLQWSGTSGTGNVMLASERYMLFQMLVGAWPLNLASDDRPAVQRFVERIVQWQVKALREAKLTSSWADPCLDHEQACIDFIYSLGAGQPDEGPLADIALFAQRVAPAGAINSLAQTILRVTVPGVPDLYQGTEFWDFSLVDPDNRREVDFLARQEALAMLHNGATIPALLDDWKSGHIKQAVLTRALQLRKDIPEVFQQGKYVALPVLGQRGAHALAFVRIWRDCLAFAVVPRLCSNGIDTEHAGARPVIEPSFWGDTKLILPHQCRGVVLTDVLRNAAHRCGPDGVLRLDELLAELPVALLSIN